MPTGYTADVGDGKVVTFRDFAMQCARAFGALIEMRDSAPDAPIPDRFEPSTYHVDGRRKAEEHLARLRAMDKDEAHRQAGVSYDNELVAYRRRERERAEVQARYEAMLDKVLAWEPPTDEHVEMKSFMVQQLEESIRFDCGFEYPKPTRQTGADWLAEEIARAERNVAYHTEEQRKEVERAEGRSRWVAALRESLDVASDV